MMKQILNYLLLCYLLVAASCGNQNEWIPQHVEYSLHWQTTEEAGYELNHAYIDSAGNAWAIGKSGIIRYRPKGADWQTESLPVKGVALYCIGGRGNDVWVGGEDGTILYKAKDQPWVVQQQPAGLVDLQAIYVSGRHVYLAGSWGVILHKTGDGNWLCEHQSTQPMSLLKIAGTPDNLYVIGNPHTILHKQDTGKWMEESAQPKHLALITLAVEGNDVYIGGDSGLILHKTGNQPWMRERTPVNDLRLSALHQWNNEVWAAGVSGCILHKKGKGPWTIQHCSDSQLFIGMYAREQDIWLAGYNGMILHKGKQGMWTKEPNTAKNALLFNLAGNGREMLAVGLYGTIIERNDKNAWIKRTDRLHDATFTGMYAEGDDGWVSASDGTLYHKKRNGPWEAEAIQIPRFTLKGGYRYGDACWLIGNPSTILYKKGNEPWKIQYKGPDKSELNAIYGSTNELWVVGSQDLLLHKKPNAEKWEQDYENKHSNNYNDITGDGEQLWIAGGAEQVLHKKRGEKQWMQENLLTAISAELRDLHFHAIRKQGNTVWVAGNKGTILYQDEGQPWKSLTLHHDGTDFQRMVVEGDNIWVIGNTNEKGVVIQIQPNKKWAKQEFPGKKLQKALLHNGIVIQTETGYLFKQQGQHTFVEKSLTSAFNQKIITASVADNTLYVLGQHSIAALTPSQKMYPVLRKMRYMRSFVHPDSLEVQVWIESPPKGRNKDLRDITLSLSAKPYTELQEASLDFELVKGSYKVLDTTANKVLLSARFEITDALQIEPGSDAADKLMVRLHLKSQSVGMDEYFILKDTSGHSYLTIYPLITWQWPNIQLEAWHMALAALLALYLLCFACLPLVFLRLHHVSFFIELARLHRYCHTAFSMINRMFMLTGLPYSQHIQNAFLKKHGKIMTDDFLLNETTAQKAAYMPLPIRVSGEWIEKPDENLLYGLFNDKQMQVQIIGQYGAGKTTLAVQICKWLIAQQPATKKLQIPILIESETTDLVKTICEQLQLVLDVSSIPYKFIEAMLKNQRLVVVIDALSEKSLDMREHILSHIHAKALIITTRRDLIKKGAHADIYLFPLTSNNLLDYLIAELERRNGQHQLPERYRIALARKIRQLFNKKNTYHTDITPMLATVIIENVLKAGNRHANIEHIIKTLPERLPQIFFQYVANMQPANDAAGNYLEDYQVIGALGRLAELSLTPAFVLHNFKQAEAEMLFAEDPLYKGLDPIQRFLDDDILMRVPKQPGYLCFRFGLLAEHMGASYLYDECVNDKKKLKKLLAQVNKLGPEAAGFKLAFEQVRAYKISQAIATSPYQGPSSLQDL